MAYILADINRSSKGEYSYDASTDTHTFISSGNSVQGYNGTYLRAFPTRDIVFQHKITVHQVDLGDFSTTGEYVIVWAMNSPVGDEADYNITGDNSDRIADGSTTESYSGRRSEGFGIAASLQLRMISGNLHVCLVNGDPSNSDAADVITAQISVDGEGNYVELDILNRFVSSGNNVTEPARANGVLKATRDFTASFSSVQVGWNGAWRYLPYWGCILHPSVAARGNENKVSIQQIEQGRAYATNEDEDENTTILTQVLGNPDRVYST
jgi:hypothetical protein